MYRLYMERRGMSKYLLLLFLFACTKEAPIPESGYSVFSVVAVSSILFDSLKVEEVRVIFTRSVDGDTIVTDRSSLLECSTIRVSGAVVDYSYPSTHTLQAKVFFKFSTQEGWVYMMNLSDQSLEYIDVKVSLGIIDEEFRLSNVIDAKTIYSTDDVKEPILRWDLPEINN